MVYMDWPVILSIVSLVLSLVSLGLFVAIFLRLRVLLTSYENKPLLTTLNKVTNELADHAGKIKDNSKDIEGILDNLKVCFQKIAVERFNPFNETGGSQSFVVALLDKNNTGVILTALHARERTRIYTKEVVNGKCQLGLSDEEKSALVKAVKNNV